VSDAWRTVVGVVGDTRDGGLESEPRPAIFMPFAQGTFSGGIVIRARGDAGALVHGVTRIVREIAPRSPVENVLTVSQIKGESIAPRRLNALLVGSFGALAVTIAAVGIAGVLAFSVNSRTREIGIRMSLGAAPGRVHRMILAEGGMLLGGGLVLGAIGGLVTTRLIRGFLYGVAPHDPATLGAVAVVMAAVGMLASSIPALRAARIDPGAALRS
jgi:ABC-type antimicrobial peptide transport system permease subunit